MDLGWIGWHSFGAGEHVGSFGVLSGLGQVPSQVVSSAQVQPGLLSFAESLQRLSRGLDRVCQVALEKVETTQVTRTLPISVVSLARR